METMDGSDEVWRGSLTWQFCLIIKQTSIYIIIEAKIKASSIFVKEYT
jgi:hypothetical protein